MSKYSLSYYNDKIINILNCNEMKQWISNKWMDTTFLNSSNTWLWHTDSHLFSKSCFMTAAVAVAVAVDLCFTTLLTSQIISVVFYSEREISDKFCSESLISAWGSVAYLQHGTHGFISLPKEVILRIFTLWKNPSTPAGFEPANLGSSGVYDNHGTTGVDL